jgi:hypothetical protein
VVVRIRSRRRRPAAAIFAGPSAGSAGDENAIRESKTLYRGEIQSKTTGF